MKKIPALRSHRGKKNIFIKLIVQQIYSNLWEGGGCGWWLCTCKPEVFKSAPVGKQGISPKNPNQKPTPFKKFPTQQS